ncbi:N-acetylneuraminate lyase-like [Atheta coriaria]|uniref:N-acetylneuraminate lyase-like n=1 Tax=Dalotia coriaria TaxID=877792 RepID=UPI0031F456CE
MMEFKVKGEIAPVFTPFKQNGDVNLDVIPQCVQLLLKDKSLTGILVNGTSGEGMSMNTAERKATAQAWMPAVKSQKNPSHVMIQVGGTSLPDVLELAKHAESIKADSILCLPDLYMKPRNISELVAYLRVVSKAAPNTPLLYYHIPMFTNVNIHMGQFLRYVRENPGCIPTFVGIKFTSNDLDEGYEALKTGFSVFLGADTLMLSASHLGFDSVIATSLNFYTTQIMDTTKSNSQRQKEQLELISEVKLITKEGCGWVPSMKVAMNLKSTVNYGPVRAPLPALTEKQVTEMKQSLAITEKHLSLKVKM